MKIIIQILYYTQGLLLRTRETVRRETVSLSADVGSMLYQRWRPRNSIELTHGHYFNIRQGGPFIENHQ